MTHHQFLIIDGYPKPSRDEFLQVGMKPAWELYRDMLIAHWPDAGYDVLLPSDPDSELPSGTSLEDYAGVLWTGCNLTIYQDHDPRVRKMVELQKKIYEVGPPAYGSCWGIQMAAVAAGGEVKANPKGREMGIARKIHLTAEGAAHPFFQGKPPVFDGFISHYDEVTRLPNGASWLASNDFTKIQALAVNHQKATFWATQYHPEYDMHEMARLFVARKSRLLSENFVQDANALEDLVERMETLYENPSRKDLRWQLAVDDDLLQPAIRQVEFKNWLEQLVIPTAARRGR